MVNCPNIKKNTASCNCTYGGCSRHGACCECLAYHRGTGQLPACYFGAQAEKSYDRSIENYIKNLKVR